MTSKTSNLIHTIFNFWQKINFGSLGREKRCNRELAFSFTGLGKFVRLTDFVK